MPTDRAIRRAPIVVSILLHAAIIVPVVLIREPPGLAGGTGSGLVVSLASEGGATGASGAEAPDIETVDAGPNPEEVSATMVEPDTIAAEAEPDPVDTAVVEAVEPPVPTPDHADDSEPEPVAATEPDAAEPAPTPAPAPQAETPAEAADIPLEEVRAQPPPTQAAAAAEPVATVAAADAATAAKAQTPPKEKPAEKSAKTAPAKSDAVETAARTTTTGEEADDVPKTKAGDGGDGTADSGSGVAALASGIRAGRANYEFLLQTWLEKHKKYPRRARLRHWEGTATLYFTIDRAGNVLSYRVQKSSGHAVLDEEVEAMIQRASPLPAAPPEIQDTRLEFEIAVDFNLK